MAGTCWTTLPTGSFFRFVQQLDFLYQTHPALWEQDYNSALFFRLDMGQTQPEIFSLARRDSAGEELIPAAQSLNQGTGYPADKIADCRLLLSHNSLPTTASPCNGGFILLPALSCMILEREKNNSLFILLLFFSPTDMV